MTYDKYLLKKMRIMVNNMKMLNMGPGLRTLERNVKIKLYNNCVKQIMDILESFGFQRHDRYILDVWEGSEKTNSITRIANLETAVISHLEDIEGCNINSGVPFNVTMPKKTPTIHHSGKKMHTYPKAQKGSKGLKEWDNILRAWMLEESLTDSSDVELTEPESRSCRKSGKTDGRTSAQSANASKAALRRINLQKDARSTTPPQRTIPTLSKSAIKTTTLEKRREQAEHQKAAAPITSSEEERTTTESNLNQGTAHHIKAPYPKPRIQ